MNEIIIDAGLNQNRVAILEDDDLTEIYHEIKDNKKIQGNIYKGRVVNVLPGMQAAFVNIGLSKNAFLYVKDALTKEMIDNNIDYKDISIKNLVKQGQEIIVQVIKEPYGTKGARVTTHITLPGRYLVLMPYSNYIGISRRITDEKERDRLRSIAEEIKPSNMGVILRTVSKDISEKDLIGDLNFLLKIFHKIEKKKNVGTVPRIVHKDLDLIQRTVRDLFNKNIDKLLINNKEKYNDIIELSEMISSTLKSRIELYNGDNDIFKEYGIEGMIKKALERKVWLKSGGYIVVDETEALTSIDVNTGKFVGSINLKDTVLKTNVEAAKEIAKQLKLRNIGGIIIIDFIDMFNKEDQDNLIHIFKKELKKDRTKTTVLGITHLGLLEMTRKKNRKKLSSRLLMECPCCNGTGNIQSYNKVITKIEKEIKRIKNHTNSEAILYELNSYMLDNIKENYQDNIDNIEKNYDIKIFLKENSDLKLDQIINRKMGSISEINDIMK